MRKTWCAVSWVKMTCWSQDHKWADTSQPLSACVAAKLQQGSRSAGDELMQLGKAAKAAVARLQACKRWRKCPVRKPKGRADQRGGPFQTTGLPPRGGARWG
eukprot:gnl/TRDRNA2_/TRDRNA2_152878_c0_seq1.p1 gnl/TRDRNA2_/TRDRNA2_152878_c0~~gnl/TRDRNA2_/TRDRNA2_152878_c0_seq1.p1  ORF type:complete len:102 (+),score=6.19 gnl/TRDRNA2_/TRDRNA2_152878_c0_seq1:539-844(+)